MKKGITKILIAALAAATVSTMAAVPAFAENTKITTGTWTATSETAATTMKTITVTNVNDDTAAALDVTAYQIIKGTYKDGKLTGYTLCDGTNTSIRDFEHPTADEITNIANKIRANTTTLTGIKMTKSGSTYTATVEAGLYIVLATSADSVVYNPAVVAVNVKDADRIAETAEGGTVSMTSYWGYSTNAYLKSSTSGFNKDFVSTNKRTGAEAFGTAAAPVNSEGDIVSIGDKISFKLDQMVIPSYSDDYADGVVYKIQDNLESPSFAGISNFLVKADAATVPAKETGDWDKNPDTPDTERTNYTIVYKDSTGTAVTGADVAKSAVSYTLEFTDEFLRRSSGDNIEITYDTVLTDGAHVNYQANRTTAVLSYTIDPSNNNNVKVKRDSTYLYTFELGGTVDGSGGDSTAKITTEDGEETVDAKDVKTYEINKVFEALETDEKYKKTVNATDGTVEVKSEHALAGAEFTLYDDAAFATVHKIWSRNSETGVWGYVDAKCVTGADGHINFKGLDTGIYYLRETAAPDGYTLNENDYQVEITGTLSDGTGTAEKGTLTTYTVTVKVKGTDGNYTDVVGSSTFTVTTPAVTKPTTDATATSFDTITNEVTVTVVDKPAEIVDTKLASLPSTGGVGTIALTIVAAVGMGGFLTLYLVNKKKKNSVEE